MNDEIIYKALRDEILSNHTKILTMKYWAVVLQAVIFGVIIRFHESLQNEFSVFLIAYGSLMTSLLFHAINFTGDGFLSIGTYLLGIEHKNKQTKGWEHWLEERREEEKSSTAFFDEVLFDIQLWIQLVYVAGIIYFLIEIYKENNDNYMLLGISVFLFVVSLIVVARNLRRQIKAKKLYNKNNKEIKAWMGKNRRLSITLKLKKLKSP